jgi:hypothetical protein
MPWVIELRVVSFPAHGQRDDEHAELGVGQPAVGFGVDQRADDVVAGLLLLARRQLHGIPDQFGSRAQRVELRELGVVAADHLVGPVESLSRSSNGTPSRPAMACSGSSRATCRTKSPDI